MLKKRPEGSQGNWAEELHEVLWAYRTTPKTATQETPYALVYGAEAIIPIEMHVKTTISGTTSQEENHELMSLSLDLLDEKREAARLRNQAYQQEVAKTYNKKLRTRTFQQGDWVLRRPEKTTGKLSPAWEGPYKIIEVRGAGAYRLQDIQGANELDQVQETSDPGQPSTGTRGIIATEQVQNSGSTLRISCFSKRGKQRKSGTWVFTHTSTL
ncbi:uncharacterized protein LOC103848524 [Brassica rapa]|uniref:uncharacterized protein LOC103848524 n=1 Tax=Brassica campestris TaxID=3711 RepID=UPI00142E55CA|nr:uncharacterized protein LOC103848524 [Brassica rapa]